MDYAIKFDAQDRLEEIQVASLPNLKEADAKRIIKQYTKQAHGEDTKPQVVSKYRKLSSKK